MDAPIKEICDFLHELRYESLPKEVVHAAKRVVVDSLGCAFGGYDEASSRVARRMTEGVPQSVGAAVIGSGQSTTLELAAFANSTMIRVLDYNDTYHTRLGGGHPSDYIPAVLAAAQRSRANGQRILTGVVAAYEIFCRYMDANTLGTGTWDHVTNGVIAAAGSAAYILGLDDDRTANTLALAIVPNIAIQATRFDAVSMWKSCAAGNACRNGIFAALLANEGLTGPPAPFEGRGGIFSGVAKPFNAVFGGDDRSYVITRCQFKRHPAGSLSQTAVDAAEELAGSISNVDEIATVTLETNDYAKTMLAGDPTKWRPLTRENADHSLPYVVATTLAKGKLTVGDFAESGRRDPRILALIDRIRVDADAECNEAWPETTMAKLAVSLRDGSVYRATAKYHRGHYLNPMTDAELEHKFHAQAVPKLGPLGAARLLERAWHLDDLETADDLIEASRIPATVKP